MNEWSTSTSAASVSTRGIVYAQAIEALTNTGTVIKVNSSNGISPILYFKYLKKKFSLLESMKLDRQLKNLEKAFNKAVENGQTMLSEKMFNEIVVKVKEAEMMAKGVKFFVHPDDVKKHKHNIMGGHISDTRFEDYTRVIPKDVLNKKKKVEGIFDSFIILHYWNDESERKQNKKEKRDFDEEAKMRDPVLFGRVNESKNWYYIADWEDEFCTLTFDQLVDYMAKEEGDVTIEKKVNFSFSDEDLGQTTKDQKEINLRKDS